MDYIVNDLGIFPSLPNSASGAGADHADSDETCAQLPADFSSEFGKLAQEWPEMIRIKFTHFTDGRGFSLARRLRRAGFSGRLRATGYLLPDQYPLLRRCGTDDVEVEIDAQNDHQLRLWGESANWRRFEFRSRLDF